MYYVYILKSQSTQKRYIGHTSNLERRLSEHNNPLHNKLKHTSRRKGPWTLVHSEEFNTRGEAMKREKWFKGGMGRKWIREHLKEGACPPVAD